ncbi:MAG: hypothetical protein AAFN92_04410, partial [Bacteroidota bacterium]
MRFFHLSTLFLLTTSLCAGSIRLLDDSPQAAFAQAEINGVAAGAAYDIVLRIDTALGFEAYRIGVAGTAVEVIGGDPNGLMYGGLRLADQLRASKVAADSGTPYVKKRGLKFNIPLDGRTPSYDDTGDAAQQNIGTMWEWDYWTHFLDNMARNRYNLLTLWSMHPYPSWVKVPEYPDVALEDVYVYDEEITPDIYRDWRGIDLKPQEKYRKIKTITMDEKIAFWRRVFRYAEDRGIDVYVFHWNIFVYGAEGKHGINGEQTDDTTIDYFRQSVKQFLLTYPTIKGIGVTAGERIDKQLTGEYSIENWMWKTYGRGIMDARAENPDIDVRFIFRRHWSDLNDIKKAFREYAGPFETSFKYARARMYSSPDLPWFDKIYRPTIEATEIPCWFNVRNDDIFSLRWGSPDYARRFIENMPVHLSPGFYMGPDGYVWGKEFTSKDPALAGRYEVNKHWYRFRIWGHTAYDPQLPADYWHEQLEIRYPGVNGRLLHDTYAATAEVVSWLNKVRYRQNDAMFSFEAGQGDHKDPDYFHTVDDFIRYGAMPEQGVQTIADYARAQGSGEGLTPFDVAGKLRSAAATLETGAA